MESKFVFDDKNNKTLKKYLGKDDIEIIIPEGIENIYSFCFKDCNVKRLVLPSSITEIDTYDLRGAERLEEVVIGKRVQKIKNNSFDELPSLKEINVVKENTHFTSYNGVLFNKKGTALIRCPMGKSGEVRLLDNTTTLKINCCSDCSKITSITNGINVKEIFRFAFKNCTSLTSLYFGKELRKIHLLSFYDLPNIKTFSVDKNNPYITEEDNVLYDNVRNVLLYVAPKKEGEVYIREGISEIYPTAFLNTSLSSITFPSSFNPIGNDMQGVFRHAPNLEKLEFLKKDVEYKNSWFGIHCLRKGGVLTNLVKTLYPQNLEASAKKNLLSYVVSYINENNENEEWVKSWKQYIKRQRNTLSYFILNDINVLTFVLKEKYYTLDEVKERIEESNKMHLTEATSLLLEYEQNNFSVDEITKNSLKAFKIKGPSKSEIFLENWDYNIIENKKVFICHYIGNSKTITLPAHFGRKDVIEFNKYIFEPYSLHSKEDEERFSKIEEVIIEKGCPEIWELFFKNLKNLKKLTIPGSMKIIRGGFFAANENLEEVKLENGVEIIERNAFAQCKKLKKINLPSSLKEIQKDAFMFCPDIDEDALIKKVKDKRDKALKDKKTD